MSAYRMSNSGGALLVTAALSLFFISPSVAQDTLIRVLRSPTGEFQPFYIAEQQGYFSDRGLQVEIALGGAPAQNIAQLQAGQADITMAGPIDVVSAVSQGLPIVAIINVQDAFTTLLTPPGSPYKTVADLKGKRLGVPFAQQSLQGIMVYRAFEAAGLSIADANLVNIPFDTVVESAKNGTVDAITPVGLFRVAAVAEGFAEVPGFLDAIRGTPGVILVANKDWVEANASAVTAFNEAMQQAYQYANAHPEAVRAIDAEFTKLPPDYIANRAINPFTAVFQREVWMDVVADMQRYALIPNIPAESDFIWRGAPQ